MADIHISGIEGLKGHSYPVFADDPVSVLRSPSYFTDMSIELLPDTDEESWKNEGERRSHPW